MHSSKTIEIWVGIFVALGIAAMFMLSMKVSNLSDFYNDSGYTIIAKFENIGGLKVKSPVKMAGVTIGRVADIRFDNDNYNAVVTLKIDSQYDKLPEDTSASIFTAGLLGEQYIGLEAGAEENYLTQNDEMYLTQSAIILEQLIGKFLFSTAANANSDGDSSNE